MNFQRANSWMIFFNSCKFQKRSWVLDTTAQLKEQFKWLIQVSMLREESAPIIYLKLASTIVVCFCLVLQYMGRISHNNNTPLPLSLTAKQAQNVQLVSVTWVSSQLKKWKCADFRVIKIMSFKCLVLPRDLLFSGTHLALVVSQAF